MVVNSHVATALLVFNRHLDTIVLNQQANPWYMQMKGYLNFSYKLSTFCFQR